MSEPEWVQEDVEAVCKNIGEAIARAANAAGGLGFALVMFDFGPNGNMAYVSNANRVDFMKVLDELRAKLRTVTQ